MDRLAVSVCGCRTLTFTLLPVQQVEAGRAQALVPDQQVMADVGASSVIVLALVQAWEADSRACLHILVFPYGRFKGPTH